MSLIKCSNCGSMFSSKATACPKCGCTNNGSVSDYNSNTNYVNSYNNGGSYQSGYTQQKNYQEAQPVYPQYDDKASIGLCILSFLIPLIGWILYFVLRGNTPVKAKACSTWAWIGFGVNVLLMIVGGGI